MRFALIFLGIVLSGIGMKWAFYRKEHPDYWREVGRSETTQNIIQTVMVLLYPGAYLLILFSSRQYVQNILITIAAHYLVLPVIIGGIEAIKLKKKRRVLSPKYPEHDSS